MPHSPASGTRLRAGAAALLLFAAACTPAPPGVSGAPATAPAPNVAWTPPPRPEPHTLALKTAADSMPPELTSRLSALTLVDVVDLALRDNPATRESWATARAAAATYGSVRGAWLPSLQLDATGTRLKTTATQGRSATQQTVYGPSLNLSYLLFDFGGRSGATTGAREALLAADWTHNATLQNVVLEVQSAFFQYLATRSLLAAQRVSFAEAQANFEAADQRHRVGLATIADVLQAKTALSQADLAAITTEGSLATARGALAVSMGLPANLPYDVDSLEGQPQVAMVADSVDGLIARAVGERPDLAAAYADVRQAEARITAARGARLPSLTLNGTGGYTGVVGKTPLRDNYTISLGLQIPLFNGFSREYDQQAATAEADAARARAQGLEQQVIFQVFSAYYTLQVATRRVSTADELLNSAERSLQAALARYREGVGTVIDLLSAESALADARAQQVQARYTWQIALAQLSHDTGLLDERGQSGIRLSADTTPVEPSR